MLLANISYATTVALALICFAGAGCAGTMYVHI
jgi:hypothetical protein